MQQYTPKSQHSCGKMGVRDKNETEAGETQHQLGGRQEPTPQTSTHNYGVCMPLTHTDTDIHTDTHTK